MIQSELVKANPKLLVFVPILYTVWSDAILTPSEISTLEGLINSQSWLTDPERKLLLAQLNPATPPTPDELMSWRAAISQVADPKISNETLVNLGIRLASLQGDGTISETLLQAKPSLSKIESTLGLISHEAIFNFQSGHKTITSEQATQQNFSVSELTKVLDGQQAELIRRVKTLISDPEFQYVSPGDLIYTANVYCSGVSFLLNKGMEVWPIRKNMEGKVIWLPTSPLWKHSVIMT